MKYLDYTGLQQYDLLIKQYIQNNIPESSEIAEALQNAYNPNSTIKIAICTQAEYNALQNPEQNVLYIISDETSEVVNVEANPTLAGTESVLGSIKIGGIKYKVSSIEANPTLSGNETTLTGLGINGVNYAMPSGGGSSEVHLYEHNIEIIATGLYYTKVTTTIFSNDSTPFGDTSLRTWLNTNGYNNSNTHKSATGIMQVGTNTFKIVNGISVRTSAKIFYSGFDIKQDSTTYLLSISTSSGDWDTSSNSVTDTVTQIL